jgi:carbon monoxide dehydrogenase subunit G
MTQFEGPVKAVPYDAMVVYDFLSDFSHFEHLLPPDKVTDWESEGDSCRFKVNGVGELGLRIVDKEPGKTIKYSADGKTPFNFFLWIQLKEVSPADSRVKITIKADLNSMMKMMVSSHINKFLVILTEAIAKYHYQ